MGDGQEYSWSDTDLAAAQRAPSARPARWDRHKFWRLMRGPALAIVVAAASWVLMKGGSPVPDLVPVFMLVVVVIAVIDGSAAGLFSAAVLVGYLVYADSMAHSFAVSSQEVARLAASGLATIAVAVVGGAPARRADDYRRELHAERERLQEALKSKGEFMNTAAHQLRTPLTVIAGYVSMLQDETFGRLPDRFHAPIYAMQRKARELTGLIDEMLLAARVQRGTVPSASLAVDVSEAVRKAVQRAEPRVTLEEATLSYQVPATPVAARVDPDHLAHILDNLLSNALTYGDGRPWVKVTVTGGESVRVMVSDRGWGIPEPMRQKIFEGFVHDVSATNQAKSGRGLGLAVSRDLAERYGGSLDLIRTQVGKGSLFVLRLPAALDES